MFHTVLCDLLGIRYPILQGAMQGAGGPGLVSAVSNAGGLGVLPTFRGTEEGLRQDIAETRRRTDRPFGVNITPVGRAFTESRARICIEMAVPVVTTGLGDPGPDAVRMLKDAGIKVVPVVPTVCHALRVEAEGADIIVASGTEAGGHVGTVATLPLVPQVVDAVKVPVVAAGGLADGRGFLAALALGACGIQLGTRLICTLESEAGDWYKDWIMKSPETHTLVTSALTGKTVRAFATPELVAHEKARLRGVPEAELRELERQLRAGRDDPDGPHQGVVGQICGMIDDIQPVATLIENIIADAARLTGGLARIADA